MNRIIDLALIAVIVFCSWFTAYNMGYNAHIEPKSDYVRITNNLDAYVVSTSSTYHSVYISDEFGECYYIYIESIYGRTVIECVDTMIEGNLVTAKDWRDSILMTLDKEILWNMHLHIV